MRLRGFTLVELMVVIGIIAVLAALLFPVLANAKESANTSKCMSNMRQIGFATQMYLTDSDSLFPQAKTTDNQPQIDDYNGSIENPDDGSVFAKLLPYTGKGGVTVGADSDVEKIMQAQEIYACPTDPLPFDSNCPDVINIGGPHVISYLVNAYFVWGLNESQVVHTASTIEYGERRSITVKNVKPYCDDIYHPWFNSLNPNLGMNGVDDEMDASTGALATTRHAAGSNFVFADSHAKKYPWTRTWSPSTNVDLHTPNPETQKDF